MVPFVPENSFIFLDNTPVQLPQFSNHAKPQEDENDFRSNEKTFSNNKRSCGDTARFRFYDTSPLTTTPRVGVGKLEHTPPLLLPCRNDLENGSPSTSKQKKTPKPRKDLECPYCSKKFRYRGNMVVHVRTHTGEKKFQCPTCWKRFSKRQNLQSHIRVHTGEQPFKCPLCDKKFARQNNLARHKVIHTGLKKYECKDCGKKFVSKSNLRSHEEVHKERPLQRCVYCMKTYKGGPYFKKHLQKHIDNGDRKRIEQEINIAGVVMTTRNLQQQINREVNRSSLQVTNAHILSVTNNPVALTPVVFQCTPKIEGSTIKTEVTQEFSALNALGSGSDTVLWSINKRLPVVKKETQSTQPPMQYDDCFAEGSYNEISSSRSTSPELDSSDTNSPWTWESDEGKTLDYEIPPTMKLENAKTSGNNFDVDLPPLMCFNGTMFDQLQVPTTFDNVSTSVPVTKQEPHWDTDLKFDDPINSFLV